MQNLLNDPRIDSARKKASGWFARIAIPQVNAGLSTGRSDGHHEPGSIKSNTEKKLNVSTLRDRAAIKKRLEQESAKAEEVHSGIFGKEEKATLISQETETAPLLDKKDNDTLNHAVFENEFEEDDENQEIESQELESEGKQQENGSLPDFVDNQNGITNKISNVSSTSEDESKHMASTNEIESMIMNIMEHIKESNASQIESLGSRQLDLESAFLKQHQTLEEKMESSQTDMATSLAHQLQAMQAELSRLAHSIQKVPNESPVTNSIDTSVLLSTEQTNDRLTFDQWESIMLEPPKKQDSDGWTTVGGKKSVRIKVPATTPSAAPKNENTYRPAAEAFDDDDTQVPTYAQAVSSPTPSILLSGKEGSNQSDPSGTRARAKSSKKETVKNPDWYDDSDDDEPSDPDDSNDDSSIDSSDSDDDCCLGTKLKFKIEIFRAKELQIPNAPYTQKKLHIWEEKLVLALKGPELDRYLNSDPTLRPKVVAPPKKKARGSKSKYRRRQKKYCQQQKDLKWLKLVFETISIDHQLYDSISNCASGLEAWNLITLPLIHPSWFQKMSKLE